MPNFPEKMRGIFSALRWATPAVVTRGRAWWRRRGERPPTVWSWPLTPGGRLPPLRTPLPTVQWRETAPPTRATYHARFTSTLSERCWFCGSLLWMDHAHGDASRCLICSPALEDARRAMDAAELSRLRVQMAAWAAGL